MASQLTPFLLVALCAALAPGVEAVTYAKDVAPIFASRCNECHGDKKSKAGLRLHTLDAALKGGKEGPVVVPGKPEDSSLFKVISLKPDDEDIMPPKGKPLTPEQIDVIRRWILSGAS